MMLAKVLANEVLMGILRGIPSDYELVVIGEWGYLTRSSSFTFNALAILRSVET